MNVSPILAALRKHKAGVFLIGLQIALTLAIVCNIVFIVGQKAQLIQRPTGLVEADLFQVGQTFVDAPGGSDPATVEKLDSMQLTDLAVLRGLPDVQYATPVNTLPLSRNNWGGQVALQPGKAHGLANVSIFTGDEQMLETLGLQLVAGRDFTPLEIKRIAAGNKYDAPVVIITRALAEKLFPRGEAVGKTLYLNGRTSPSIIVGVIARMLTPNADGPGSSAWNGVLIPNRIDDRSTLYAVRAKPGRMQAAMREARDALFKADPMRIIPEGGRYLPEGIRSFAQIRIWGYALDLFMVQILTVVCLILLAVTCVGMTGLTSFWVNQRHKQIGIRRALGATRADILHYFQLENLLIAGGGCVVGIVLAIGINLMLLRMFQMDRMPVWYVVVGVIVILALGQLAVFAPAHRASKVPPVVATRSV
jgi:putative ABC transport system permease protein